MVDRHRGEGDAARDVEGVDAARAERRRGGIGRRIEARHRRRDPRRGTRRRALGIDALGCDSALMGSPMNASALAEQIDAFRALVEAARVVVGFTGAGISTESGVPDFRSPGSPWLQNKPIPFEAYVRSAEARREAWRRKFHMDDLYRGARPSRGHRALATLVARGKMPAVITQNIDGLQQQAGVGAGKVIELHGNGTYATCLDCGGRRELDWVR